MPSAQTALKVLQAHLADLVNDAATLNADLTTNAAEQKQTEDAIAALNQPPSIVTS